MARFKQVILYIDRSTFSLGSVCYINYEYFISFDSDEISSEKKFILYCELWGDDIISEKRLSKNIFDKHLIVARNGFSLSRNFTVPCDLLNEKPGEDRLFIVLRMEHDNEVVDSIRSKQIRDAF